MMSVYRVNVTETLSISKHVLAAQDPEQGGGTTLKTSGGHAWNNRGQTMPEKGVDQK